MGMKVGPLRGVAQDVSQNPHVRHRAGPFVCSPQQSSQFISLSHNKHLYTTREMGFMIGWPTPGLSLPKYDGILNYDIEKLLLSLQQSLLGNGIAPHVVQAWFLYLLGHMVPRHFVEGLSPSLASSRPRQLTAKQYDDVHLAFDENVDDDDSDFDIS